jgi:hypothetical protein
LLRKFTDEAGPIILYVVCDKSLISTVADWIFWPVMYRVLTL